MITYNHLSNMKNMNLFGITTRDDRWKSRSLMFIIRNFEINDEDTVRSLLSEIVKGDRSSSIHSWAEINNEHIIEFERRLGDIKLASSSEITSHSIEEDIENLKISADENNRPSAESEVSMGSNAAVSALRKGEILLSHISDVDIIRYQHNNDVRYRLSPSIAFSFNKHQRSKTYLPGNSQGDHISSYIAIIMAFINTIRNESGIDQAIDEIRNVGHLLLSDDPDAMQQIRSKDIYLSLSSEDRNRALEFISGHLMASTLDKNGQMIELPLKVLVKKSLINDKINAKACLLSELTDCILRKIQESKDFTVYSRGRIDARKDEGATAKSSIRGLMALDKLCFISRINEDEKFQEEISYLLNSLSRDDRKISAEAADEGDEDGQDAHLMRYGINAWFEDDGMQSDLLKDELERARGVEARKEILDKYIGAMMNKNQDEKTISAFIGGLFDYDRKLVFNCETAFPVTKTDLKSIDASLKNAKTKTPDQARIRKIKDIIIANVTDQFGDEFPKRNIKIDISYDDVKKKVYGEISLTRYDTDKLAKIIINHLGILDLVCSNMLMNPTVNPKYQESKKDFVDSTVLRKACWNEIIQNHALNLKMEDQITEKLSYRGNYV